ncbi:MAG: SOS response-associated peptidase family protein [Steroidobacteraceae bacterium]
MAASAKGVSAIVAWPALVRITCRVPVIVEPPDWPLWLGETEGDAASLLHPAAEDTLLVWPVSTRVNRPANNDADLLAPLPPA